MQGHRRVMNWERIRQMGYGQRRRRPPRKQAGTDAPNKTAKGSPMTNGHGNKSLTELEALCSSTHKHRNGDRFGRLFPGLSPFYCDPDILGRLGGPNGPMKAAARPARTKKVPVGFVFLGQFIDHDITLDITSSLDTVNVANQIPNARTPTLDLDCIYGAGPEAQPFMYSSDRHFKGAKLLTGTEMGESGHRAKDLARVNDVAMIGDFRNDENRIISQLQLGMIRYHNQICEELHAEDSHLSGKELYEAARQHCMWHYQWVVLNEFLPTMCGQAVVDRVMARGRQFYRPKAPFIPVEFSVAAYRFGHSMVPQKIRVQAGGPEHDLFGPELGGGFAPVPSDDAVVEWAQLFDLPGAGRPQFSHRCAPKMAADLLSLPPMIDSERQSLATRNLERGQGFLLPSGEAVAEQMGMDATHIAKVTAAAATASKGELPGATPLWYWLLTEADVVGRETKPGQFHKGEGLGPVGATIVAEVLIGLMERDGRSWLSSNRSWKPKPNQRSIGAMLNYGGVIDLNFKVGTAKKLG